MRQQVADTLGVRSRGRNETGRGWRARRAWGRLVRATPESAEALQTMIAVALDTTHPRCLEAVRVLIQDAGQLSATRAATIAIATARNHPGQTDSTDYLLQIWEPAQPEAPLQHEVLKAITAITSDNGHPRRREASDGLSTKWFETTDERLAAAIIENDINPSATLAGTAALALRGVLTATPENAPHIVGVLDHVDSRVITGAVQAVEQADIESRSHLWRYALRNDHGGNADQGSVWSDRPVARLLRVGPSPDSSTIDLLWSKWYVEDDQVLASILVGWGRPADASIAELSLVSASRIALTGPGRGERRQLKLDEISVGLTEQPHSLDHLVGDYVSAASNRELLEEFCELALVSERALRVCRTTSLAPRDPVKRARFFLLSDQVEQYRHLDPDGSLLSLVYASAAADDRQRILSMMRQAGRLDLMRIVVGGDRRARVQSMTRQELEYLVSELARQEVWADLWSIAQDLPLARAHDIVGQIDLARAGRSLDAEAAELIGAVQSIDRSALIADLEALQDILPPAVREARIVFHGRVNDVAFAPDAPVLTAAGSKSVVGLIDLSAGELTHRWLDLEGSVGRVLHVGHGKVIAGERTNGLGRSCSVVALSATSRETLQREPGSVTDLALLPDGGFLAASRCGLISKFTSLGNTFSSAHRIEYADNTPYWTNDWPRAIGVSDDGSRISVLGQDIVVFNQALQRLIAGFGARAVHYTTFVGNDTIAAGSPGGLITLYQIRGSSLVQIVARQFDGLVGLGTLRSRAQLVAVDKAGNVHFLNATDLATTATVEPPAPEITKYGFARHVRATSAHVAPGEDLLALGYASGTQSADGFCDIYDLRIGRLPLLANTPLALATPGDLGSVMTARAAIGTTTGVSSMTLDLLHQLLTYRFRFDIEISDLGALKSGEYDIYLE